MTKAHATWVIYLSLLVALLFMLLPIPMDWRFLRPDIAALVLFYWALALPHRVGVATAFALGIAQDLVEGAPLGLTPPGGAALPAASDGQGRWTARNGSIYAAVAPCERGGSANVECRWEYCV